MSEEERREEEELTELELLTLAEGNPHDYAYLLGKRLQSPDAKIRREALAELDRLIKHEEDPNT